MWQASERTRLNPDGDNDEDNCSYTQYLSTPSCSNFDKFYIVMEPG
jgi:hypothetical protein